MATVNGNGRIGLFRATDAFALEAYRVASGLQGGGDEVAHEIRRTAVISGGAVVAASAERPGETRHLDHLCRARNALVEGRYYLYLARRFGLLDARRYRALTLRQDAALREIESALESAPPSERPPPAAFRKSG